MSILNYKKNETVKPSGFIGGMIHDKRGNTIALVAAGLVPMAAMIGGGVDMSRGYMAKSRLQQACDAGALAARKQLAGQSLGTGNSLPASVESHGQKFFRSNFSTSAYGTANSSFNLGADADGNIAANASVDVPTAVMKIFGKTTMTLNVTCSAELSIANIDVMFVVDTTGSMGDTNPGDTDSKLAGLKSAVFDFYDTVQGVAGASSQVRYGFVPYSSTVNVGSIINGVDSSYLVDSHTYQSREAKFTATGNGDGIEEGDILQQESSEPYKVKRPQGSGGTLENFYGPGDSQSSEVAECNAFNGDVRNGNTRTQSSAVLEKFRNGNWRNYKCMVTDTITFYAGPGDVRPETYNYTFDKYEYKPISFNTASYKAGTAVTTQTGFQGADVTSTWNGCIEERDTVVQADYSTVPTGAYDVDIDFIPNSDETRWRPHWPELIYNRAQRANLNTTDEKTQPSGSFAACPTASQKLRTFPSQSDGSRNADFTSYVNSLSAIGGTYHDIGMIWGARLISPTGILASENATAPNGDPIGRHIIFMTDGAMSAYHNLYSAYGVEQMDGRVWGTGSYPNNNQLTPYHNSRLQAICDATRNKNITVWVVAFGTTLTQNLIDCADPGKAYSAANSADLSQAFQEIGSKIAELRLTN